MNAIVVTPALRGWGFPPRTNLLRIVRRPVRRAPNGATEDTFREWADEQPKTPKPLDVCMRFGVSRATAYRWLATRKAEQEAA